MTDRAHVSSTSERGTSRGADRAPYPRMSPRIALTTLGQLETVEQVDEARVVAFIEKYL